MADEKKKITKYIVLAAMLAALNLFLNFKEFSFGYILTSACFIASIFILFRYLLHRKEYEEQSKETLLQKTKIFYLQMCGLYTVYACYKIFTTGNWRLFILEGVVIAVLFLTSYFKLK